MPIPTYLLPQRAIVRRRSNLLEDATSCPATLTFSYTTVVPVLVQVHVAGVTSPITVNITGELNSVPQTEALTVGTSGNKRSSKQWTKVTQVDTAGTAGAIKAYSLFMSGEKAYSEVVLHSDLPCRTERVSTTRREFLTESPGGFQLSSLVIFHTNASDLDIGDKIEVDNVQYEVENPVHELDQGGFHHTEAILKRLQAN